MCIRDRQEGEDCGDCLSPSTNFFCGECAAGLECRKTPILPDAPGTCEKGTGSNTSYNYAGVNLDTKTTMYVATILQNYTTDEL